MKKLIKIIAITLVVIFGLSLVLMKVSGITLIALGWHDPIASVEGIAIKGYDPVAYFTDSLAKKGSEKFSSEWEGTQWQFTSAEHKNLFDNNPEKFAPQYGGHCAFAASTGFAVKGNPDSWKIIEGKLYILSGKEVENSFVEGGKNIIHSCDANWK